MSLCAEKVDLDQVEDLMGHFKSRKPRIDLSRPSISVGDKARHWQEVQVCQLQVRDIVAGWGIVKFITECDDGSYYLEVGESSIIYEKPKTKVLAFIRKD